ncbi:MAG TPA: hypothetical protein VFF37_06630 [Streptomyces sp.]|nr:hypothetical protein [Streptomyces sp.]
MRPNRHDLRPCPTDCGQPVLWTKTEHGERMAVDARPHPDGNQACWKDGLGVWRSRSLDGAGAMPPAPHEHTYKPHIATCTRKQPVQAAIPGLPANVVGIGTAQRRRRARR